MGKHLRPPHGTNTRLLITICMITENCTSTIYIGHNTHLWHAEVSFVQEQNAKQSELWILTFVFPSFGPGNRFIYKL